MDLQTRHNRLAWFLINSKIKKASLKDAFKLNFDVFKAVAFIVVLKQLSLL